MDDSKVDKDNIDKEDVIPAPPADPALPKEFFLEVLKVKTTSHHCEEMTKFVSRWAEDNGFDVVVEECGNVLVTKGKADSYVCFVNHMDTVHKYDMGLNLCIAVVNGRTEIFAVDDKNRQVGVGADDKAGCAIAMAVMMKTDKPCKAAFFVDEEPGMLGSQATNWDWFKDVKFGLCFDSPDRNRSAKSCSGYNLFNDKIFQQLQPFALKHGVTKFNHEPYTDVVQLVKHDIPCWVTGNGGLAPHSKTEYVVYEDADETYKLGLDFLEQDFDFSGFKYEPPLPTYSGYGNNGNYTDYANYSNYSEYGSYAAGDYDVEYYVDDINPNVVLDMDGVIVCMAADPETASCICDLLNAAYKKKYGKKKKSKSAQHVQADEMDLEYIDRLADEDAKKCQKDSDVDSWLEDLRMEHIEEQNTSC